MSNEGVTAVERALSVLDCFQPGAERLSLADLAHRLPLHKTTIYRLLNSLERLRYVVRHPDGRYSLGPRLMYLGRVYERGFELTDVLEPYLRALSRETGETASYYVRSGTDRLCLIRIQPEVGVHDQLMAGSLLPIDDSATGLVFKGWDAPGGAPLPLPTYSSGLYHAYTTSWAVPVFGVGDAFAGALTLSGLAARVAGQAEAHQRVLLAHGAQVSAALGASAAQCGKLYSVQIA